MITELHNICPHCGAENTIWPIFRGRKRIYICGGNYPKDFGGCGKLTKGITKTQWLLNFRRKK